MTKKTKARSTPPNVNIFATVDHETWRKLTVLAATVGIGRLELYSFALKWAVSDKGFTTHLINLSHGKTKKAKK